MMRGDNERTFAVLFVDDEEKAQKYFRMAYANEFPVLTASSVLEALEILEQKGDEIAVLITDQRMPGQQGVDLLKRAREDWPTIVRILTTAYSDLDDAIAAVNRGEILRYVTKPWDIESLRVDLLHALDFYLLRHERDLLLSQKFSVRQRTAQGDHLVGLLAIAAGLEHLRHATYAVAAWAHDAYAGGFDEEPAVADRELWGLQVRDTLDLMQKHHRLRSLNDSVESGFPDRADPAELLRSAGLAVQGSAGEVTIRRDLIDLMIGTLARLAGDPASARWEWNSTADGNRALTLRVTGPGTLTNPFAGSINTNDPDGDLLGSYLIAWHHGGALNTSTAGGEISFTLTLPEEPAAVVRPKPDEDTLAGFFSMLEDWG